MATTEKNVFNGTRAIEFSRGSQKVPLNPRRKRSPRMSTSQVTQFAKSFTEPVQDPDKFLRAVVDACASNVAVLDEAGAILFASKAWQLFEKGNGWSRQSTSTNDFEEWKR